MVWPRRHQQHLGVTIKAGVERVGVGDKMCQGQHGVTRLRPRTQKGDPRGEEKEKKNLNLTLCGGLQVATDHYDAQGPTQRPCVHGAVFYSTGDDDDHVGR